ncbi:hypothetical protein ACQCVP_07875 [Rossellomorea vietnamensis]
MNDLLNDANLEKLDEETPSPDLKLVGQLFYFKRGAIKTHV